MSGLNISLDLTDEAAAEAVRLLGFHGAGLKRITRVIDGSANYDAILEGKVKEDLVVGLADKHALAERITFAVERHRDAFRSNVVKTIYPRNTGTACFGTTANNIKELQFFQRMFPTLDLMSNNLANFSRTRLKIDPPLYHLAADLIERDVIAFYTGRETINPNIVHQQIAYSRNYLSLCAAFFGSDRKIPSLFVVSNDHMPVHVAASMVMRALGVPRVYLQHAEVSRIFPPLDFEVSVLRSEGARETYAAIADISGKTFIIPRTREPFQTAGLILDRERVTAVVYPTARVIVGELQRAIDQLSANPLVDRVLLKPHPASLPKLESVITGVEFVCAVPSVDHIAIVGNSSIAVDLIYQGVPVYQLFEADPVERDYYRLVADGVTMEVAIRSLSSRFWQPYSLTPDWQRSYARRRPLYDDNAKAQKDELIRTIWSLVAANHTETRPITDISLGERGKWRGRAKAAAAFAAERLVAFAPDHWEKSIKFIVRNSSLRDRIRGLGAPSGKGAKPKVGRSQEGIESFAAYALSTAADPKEWLFKNSQAGAFSDLQLIRSLELLFRNRDPSLSKLFALSEDVSGSAVATWLQLKKADWGLEAIDDVALAELAKTVWHGDDVREVRGVLEGLLLDLIQRGGNPFILRDFFAHATVARVGDLSINRQIALVRSLRAFPENNEEANRLRAMFEKRAHGFHRLKFLNMDVLDGHAPETWDHSAFVNAFLKEAPDPLAGSFRKSVLPVYTRLQNRMRFMDVRNSEAQAQEIKSKIRASLQQRNALSILRLSDGEGYVFASSSTEFSHEDVKNRERHWWGQEIPREVREQITLQVNSAIRECDIIGIPSVYRFIRDHTARSSSLSSAIQGRGLLAVLQGIEELASRDASFTEDKVNVALFRRVADLIELAANAEKTVLVSSVKPERLPHDLRQKVETIAIPTHHRTSANNGYHVSDRPLPYVYKDILQKVVDASSAGSLILVAGGIIGKCFIGAAKARGAVAIDIGSVVDEWSAKSAIGFR